MEYLTDGKRHLICRPFSIEGLHLMAKNLNIKRCWFQYSKNSQLPHYDIPKSRIAEIESKCTIVSFKEIVQIIKEWKIKNTANQGY